MLKLIVADDEKFIRKGIIKIIQEMADGYEVVGEAADGAAALELIEETQPDVVITDIKMPQKNGVELIQELRERRPELKVIVLSGFDDFQYVRETLKQGAVDYLLKPIDEPQFLALLHKLKTDLATERQKKRHEENIQARIAENLAQLQEQFITNLVCRGGFHSEELVKNAECFSISLAPGEYCVMVVGFNNYGYLDETEDSEDIKAQALRIENAVRESLARHITSLSFRNERSVVFLYPLPKDPTFGETILSDLRTNWQSESRLHFTIGVGLPVAALSDLKQSYQSALEFLKHRFYMTAPGIIRSNDCRPFQPNRPDFAATLENNLRNCVEIVQYEPVAGFIADYCEKMKELNVEPDEVVKSLDDIFAKLIFERDGFKETVIDIYGYGFSYRHVLSLFDTWDYIAEYTGKMYTDIISRMAQNKDKRGKKLFAVVKEYLANHYQEEITLNKMAAITYVTPNYICELFKEQTGASLIDYLTKIRIQKAKELLKDVRIKAYEVGHLVGYDDPAYFSRVFKKVVGVSPQEYRNLVE